MLCRDLPAGTPVIRVAVDVKNAGQPLPRDLWGINVDTEGPNPVEDEYRGMRDFQPPVVRFPGGLVANYYHWDQTLGPASERKPQWNCIHQAQFAPLTGAAEYLTLLNSLNAKGMITLNVSDGTPQEAAAWVAFCRGRIGDSRVIGKDVHGRDWMTVDHWAQRRLELTGIREPVNVLYWELGQAVDFLVWHHYTGMARWDDWIIIWGSAASALEDNLVQKFECPSDGEYEIETRAFGQGVTPKVIQMGDAPRIAVKVDDTVLKTFTLSGTLIPITVKVRLTAGRHLFKISFLNDYYAPPEDTNVMAGRAFYVTKDGRRIEYFFPQVASQFRKDLDEVKKALAGVNKDIEQACPRLFIALTEYNRGEGACYDLEAALYVAELQRFFTEIPRIRTATIWNSVAGNFGITYTRSDLNVRRVRLTGYVFELAKDLQDRTIPVTMTPDNPDIRILATKNSCDGNLAVLGINLGNTPVDVRFTLPDGTPLAAAERKFITGNSLYDNNEKTEKIVPVTQRIANPGDAVAFPGYSVSVVIFPVKGKD